jgi:serine/threonine protein phosphatase PrpC
MRVAACTRALPGQSHNGDAYLLAKMSPDRSVLTDLTTSSPQGPAAPLAPGTIELGHGDLALLAVVDGVGHGPEAAAVAASVLQCLRSHVALDLVSLVRECHRAIAQSRGATLGLAWLSPADEQVEFLGVGDVTLRLVRHSAHGHDWGSFRSLSVCNLRPMTAKTLVGNRGTLGYGIPQSVLTSTCELRPGETVMMCTDGLCADAAVDQLKGNQSAKAERAAASVLWAHASDRDDATVVVAR